MRTTLAFVVVVIGLTACSTGPMSASEYASEAEGLVADMQGDFATLDAAWESQVPTLDGAIAYWDRRLEIRADFLEAVEALDPPPEIAAQHEAALDVFSRITTADERLAARVAEYEAVTEHRQWLDTPEGQESLAVLDEVYAFCRASQAEYDATSERGDLADAPWVPAEMKEIVSVAFGCPPSS